MMRHNKRMNRSELALASFGTNYECNPTCRPVILGVRQCEASLLEQLAFLSSFADQRQLLYKSGSSPDGLAECYVYSIDMEYRYVFARWWDANGSLVLWVGVN